MSIIIQIIISALAVYFTAWLLPGVSIENFPSAIIVAIVLGLLNVFLKPILQIVSLPITILTLGFFLLIINAFIIILASYLVGSFHVDNFWWALVFSIIVSVVIGIMEGLIDKN
jgi:putative membrane protein